MAQKVKLKICIMILSIFICAVSFAFHGEDNVQIAFNADCAASLLKCLNTNRPAKSHCQNDLDQSQVCLPLRSLPANRWVQQGNLKIKKIHNWFLLEKTYQADGQVVYAILTADNQLISVSHWLDAKTKKDILIFSAPTIKKLLNNYTLLTFKIAKRPCVACATKGQMQLSLHLNAQGWTKATI